MTEVDLTAEQRRQLDRYVRMLKEAEHRLELAQDMVIVLKMAMRKDVTEWVSGRVPEEWLQDEYRISQEMTVIFDGRERDV